MSEELSQDDLSYLRSMAESGERAPLVGGRYLVNWGGLAVIGCIAHWAITAGKTALEPQYVGAVWMVYGVVGLILQAMTGRSLASKAGTGSIGNRANRAAWRSVGAGIGLYVGGILFSVTALDASPLLFDSILTVAFFGYAIAFSVTASLSGQKWLFGASWISIAAAAITPAFYGRPELYLIAASIILFAAVLPGMRMMQREKQGVS